MKAVPHTLFFLLIFFAATTFAQDTLRNRSGKITDSITNVKKDSAITITGNNVTIVAKDTLKAKTGYAPKHDPRKATRRSAILPGWGQAYNREYWKIPLVYTAIGIPAGFYIYNSTWYKRAKNAFIIRTGGDTSRFVEIHPKLQGLSTESIRYYRNEFRRDKDYSILYFLIAWGVNVVDATVFGHLKDFDVSDDLSFRIKPGLSNMGNTAGLSLVLAVKDHPKRTFAFTP
jgi:hypothetical protein